jgi:hypothetical protein
MQNSGRGLSFEKDEDIRAYLEKMAIFACWINYRLNKLYRIGKKIKKQTSFLFFWTINK